jgi:type IV pilus assembly protein PilM
MADESIWKKELRFRKSGPSAPQPAPAVPEGERPASIWKRELKFRKPFELTGTNGIEPGTEATGAEAEPQPEEALSPIESTAVPEASESDVPGESPAPAEPAAPVMEAQPVSSPEPEPQPAVEEPAAQWAEPSSLQSDTVPEPVPGPRVEASSEPWWAPPATDAPTLPEPVVVEATSETAPFPPAEPVQAAPPAAELPVEISPSPELATEQAQAPSHEVERQPTGEPFDTAEEPAALPAPELDPAPAVQDAASDPVELFEAQQPVQPVEVPPVEIQPAEAMPAPAASWTAPKAASEMPEENEDVVESVAVAAPAAKSSLLKRELKLSRPRRRKAAAAAAMTVAAAPAVAQAAVPEASDSKRGLKLPKPGGGKKPAAAAMGPFEHKAKNVVGLRIGSSQLAAAYVHNNGAAELEQLARSPIPRGIVSGGEVRDPEALTREIKKFFVEHKLPRRGVRLGIASNRIGVRMLEVPAVDDPKLFDNSVRFHAQEVLPIPVTDAILDYVQVGEGRAQGLEPAVRLLLVFAHRELVERHVDACRRAGLKLEGVDFEAFALLRALTVPLAEGDTPTQAVVAVAVGHERTIFAVSDGRTCDFTRVLEWGGGTLDVAIGRALNLTPSQAEPVKLALALDGSVAPSQLSADEAEAARAAIRNEIQALARELVSSLQFYQSRLESLDIGSILLSGGGSELNGFAEELSRAVGVPVELGDPLSRVELGRKINRPAELGSLAVAIGLGIED